MSQNCAVLRPSYNPAGLGKVETWQSMRSVMPPWPGMESPKSLILKPRLKPDAKKPPKGAMMDANIASTTACSCIQRIFSLISRGQGKAGAYTL